MTPELAAALASISSVSDALAAINAGLNVIGGKVDVLDQLAEARGDQWFMGPDADCEISPKGRVDLMKQSADGTFTLGPPEINNDFGILIINNRSFKTHTVVAPGLIYDGDSTPKGSIVIGPAGSIVLHGKGSTDDPPANGFYYPIGTPFNAVIS